MKKIKTLYWIINALIVIYIIHFSANIYLTFFPPDFMNFSDEFYNKFIFGYYTQFIGLVFSLIVFIAFFSIKKGLSLTIKNGFFNNNSSSKFKTAGKLLLTSGILSFIWNIILLVYSNGESLFAGIITDVLLILIGFGLLIIADVIINGNLLKHENDLTI